MVQSIQRVKSELDRMTLNLFVAFISSLLIAFVVGGLAVYYGPMKVNFPTLISGIVIGSLFSVITIYNLSKKLKLNTNLNNGTLRNHILSFAVLLFLFAILPIVIEIFDSSFVFNVVASFSCAYMCTCLLGIIIVNKRHEKNLFVLEK